jgi:hypothetical protein
VNFSHILKFEILECDTGVREEWCGGGGASFPPRGAREEERCSSREKQISRSGLGSASSRDPSAC